MNDEWIIRGASHFKINKKNILLQKINKFFQNYLKKKIDNSKNFYFICSCNYFKKLVYNNFKIKRKNIKTIYNPVDTNFWKKKNINKINFFRKKYNFSKENLYILFIARGGLQNFRKGGDRISQLVEALSKYNNLKFVILGQKRNVDNLINSRNCIFIESRSKVFLKKLFYSCDITIHMSRAEGIPYSMLETMSCSLPTITLKTGGISEIIKNKNNGYIYKSFNLQTIIRLIKKLSLNKSLIKKLGINASRTIDQKFSFKKVKLQYLNFLNQ